MKEAILDIINENPGITLTEIKNQIGVRPDIVSESLNELCNNHKLKQLRDNKNNIHYYYI